MANKTYKVECHWDVAKLFDIQAEDERAAIEKLWKKIQAGEVCVWSDGFTTTDDVEVGCVGEKDDNGEDHYYS